MNLFKKIFIYFIYVYYYFIGGLSSVSSKSSHHSLTVEIGKSSKVIGQVKQQHHVLILFIIFTVCINFL
jgi:hypothetical protein